MTRSAGGPLARLWADRPPLASLLLDVETALPLRPAADRAMWEHADSVTVRALRTQAESERDRPWPTTSARTYAQYHRDGDRLGHETAVGRRQQRLTRAAVLAAVTLEDAWLDEVADGVLVLCEQSSWCWPAHDDTRSRHGAVLPTVTEPFLDLGAGEVAAQLAWVDQLLGGPLDGRWPGLRARIRHEVVTRVLEPFRTRRDWHWLGLDGDVHNWNPWIHGNVLVAALRLVDDGEVRAQIVATCIEGIDRYVAALPPDGAIDEGYAYWWNGAGRALEALALLRHATGGALDASSLPRVRQTVAFPHRMQLGDGWYVNAADGQARPAGEQPWPSLLRAARWVGDTDAQALALSHRAPGTPVADVRDGLGRLLLALSDQAWVEGEPARAPLPRDIWLGSIQMLVARQRAGTPAGLTLAAKGGHNGEHHNHNDVGSVLVALGGVPVVVDAGRPTYTAQTFGPDRYAIWTMQSSWHNVPEIRGTAQAVGREFVARDVHVTIDDERTVVSMDLAAAYPRSDVRGWRRRCELDRAQGRVLLTDAWDLAGPGAVPSVLHLLVAGEVRLEPERALVEALNGAGTLELRWPSGVVSVTSQVCDLEDPMLTVVWGARLTRLALELVDDEQGESHVVMEAG